MIEKIYYDSFTNEYVLEKDHYAAPERYVETVRGESGIYIDHWLGEKNGVSDYRLNVAYTEEEYYSNIHDIRLWDMCKRENFRAKKLQYFTLPQEKFDEYVERFGLNG